jgi:polar amino acid transport system substrate-binding protein
MMMSRRLALLALWPVMTSPILAQVAPSRASLRLSTLPDHDLYAMIALEVLKHAYRKQGLTFELSHLPNERSLQYVNTGESDGELFRAAGLETNYPNLLMLPVPLMTMKIVVFARSATTPTASWAGLRGKRIGLVRGCWTPDDRISAAQLQAVATMDQALMKLVLGRTDVVVGGLASGLDSIANNRLPNITILKPLLLSFPVFHYLHVRHHELARKLTHELELMRDDGSTNRIYDMTIAMAYEKSLHIMREPHWTIRLHQ